MDLIRTNERDSGVPLGLERSTPGGGLRFSDPLAEDAPDDDLLLTSERRLQRVAIVACDVGARYQREGLSGDPVAWMLAPRAMFGGATALEACQERRSFLRAAVVHGLSLGLDADPEELDALIEGDEDPEDAAAGTWDAVSATATAEDQGLGGQLYTCTLEGRLANGDRHVQSFCAMVATDEGVVRRRLRARYGDRLGDAALITAGFDRGNAVATFLLSASVGRMLEAVAADPASDVGRGLDLHIEQRFAA